MPDVLQYWMFDSAAKKTAGGQTHRRRADKAAVIDILSQVCLISNNGLICKSPA